MGGKVHAESQFNVGTQIHIKIGLKVLDKKYIANDQSGHNNE